MTNRVWEVDIFLVGPISIARSINFKQKKGFSQDQFYSNISLASESYGIKATVTAFADTDVKARIAAFVFFGQMVDVLIYDNEIPLIMQNKDLAMRSGSQFTTRRTVNEENFIAAFRVARSLEKEHPRLLRAIGWYAKGKVSNNTLDAFLSFWNVLEIVGVTYHTPNERTELGVINKVYQCFLENFGDEKEWLVDNQWINRMHEKRSSIAHGGENTTAEAIHEISVLIPELDSVGKRLIEAVIHKKYGHDILQHEYWMAHF